MTLRPGQIHQLDCVAGMRKLPAGSVDLAFADPPFNIGYEYDVYNDLRERDQYLDWSKHWISAVHRALKPSGTFWLAIGDEYAAELKILSQDVGFHCRSWVIWYYTFGVNCKLKFSRSHAHLFHFVKDPEDFTFNDHEIRVPSARQLVYADARANPVGRLPDDTWILRPQDIVDGLTPDEDLWYFPRVAGTFKERAGFHGCQMPEQLLGRIVRACSHPGELVLDPFSGSATTLTVAKKLGRKWIGFEISDDYVSRGRARVAAAAVGDPLDGAPEPRVSAPATHEGKTRDGSKRIGGRGPKKTTLAAMEPEPEPAEPLPLVWNADSQQGIIDAFARASDGFSVDRTIVDPDLNAVFIETCRRSGVPGTAAEINRMLFRLRKAGRLAHLPSTRRTEFAWSACDQYVFASEIALRQMTDREGLALDEIFCSPEKAACFDAIAQAFAPGWTPLEYRWAALRLRKGANLFRHRSQAVRSPDAPAGKPVVTFDWKKLGSVPGTYLVCDGPDRVLYAGESIDLGERFQQHFGAEPQRERWSDQTRDLRIAVTALPETASGDSIAALFAHQSRLIGRFQPALNYLPLAVV